MGAHEGRQVAVIVVVTKVQGRQPASQIMVSTLVICIENAPSQVTLAPAVGEGQREGASYGAVTSHHRPTRRKMYSRAG
jgi:hypothetical protein